MIGRFEIINMRHMEIVDPVSGCRCQRGYSGSCGDDNLGMRIVSAHGRMNIIFLLRCSGAQCHLGLFTAHVW